MPRYDGVAVVVCGGSSGIGLATAEAFARLGADVGLVARDPARLEAAREAVQAARVDPGQKVAVAAADLASIEETERALARLRGAGIDPHVLVNSAGSILPGEFTRMPYEYFADNMESFWAAVNACRVVAPRMCERGRGHIVNVSSVAGFLGIYGYTAYSAAKFALMGFSEALRFEMRPAGVSVHVVCPPDTETPGLSRERTLRPTETEVIAGAIKAVAPSVVADAIVRGVERGRYMIIPDVAGRVYFRLKGLLPEVFFAIVDGDVRKARRARTR